MINPVFSTYNHAISVVQPPSILRGAGAVGVRTEEPVPFEDGGGLNKRHADDAAGDVTLDRPANRSALGGGGGGEPAAVRCLAATRCLDVAVPPGLAGRDRAEWECAAAALVRRPSGPEGSRSCCRGGGGEELGQGTRH